MNQRLCPNRTVCEGSDSPFANLSSEADDPALFLGVVYCWGLVHQWYPRICFSEVNTPDANQCAGNLCLVGNLGWPFGFGMGTPPSTEIVPPQPGGTGPTPADFPPDLTPAQVQDPPGSDNYVTPPSQVIVWNEEQTCVVCIPDGPCFTYICAAGTFYAIGP